jgi:hypothetical protein
VHTPWSQNSGGYVVLAPLSADTAWCLVQTIINKGTRFTLYRTTDAGRHWSATLLPVPRHLPADG